MKKKKWMYALSLTVMASGLIAGVQCNAATKQDKLPLKEIQTFAEVYGQVKANYYENTEDSKLVENAMKGMVSGLDPHSEYLTKEDFQGLKELTSGKFGGLGMEITKENNAISVISPIEDTPAARAGIKPGDLIIKIDGVSTKDMSTMEASKKMRGKPGTHVVLTVLSKGRLAPVNLDLQRAIIHVRSVKSKLMAPHIGYIRVSTFSEETLADFIKQLQSLIKENHNQPLKGLIFDLRNDGGGLLNAAVGVTGAFIPSGAVVVSTKGRNKIQQTVLKASPEFYRNPGESSSTPDLLQGLPLGIKQVPIVVLINSGTASASEIVTGALQDYRRAVVVGTQSFGKASVQTVIPLQNEAGLKLTVALYYTPKDRSIQARGIVPDIEVKSVEDELFDLHEADFDNHLSAPGAQRARTIGKENKTISKLESIDPEAYQKKRKELQDKFRKQASFGYIPDPKTDIQLKKALDVVQNHALWQKSLGAYVKNEAKIKKAEKKLKRQ